MDKHKEKLIQSKGWQAIKKIGTFNEMLFIFDENFKDLMHEIARLENSPEPFIELHFDTNNNLNRYNFNFLAASKALIDNCRSMMNYYKDTEIYEKYQNNINELFKTNSLAHFVQDFRNYQTHCRVEFSELSDTNEIIFLTEELLQNYKKWNKLSNEYIQQCKNKIILKTLFNDYYNLVFPFYMWLYKELKEFHKEDLKERRELAAQCGITIVEI
jgi:hypothetical protein